MTLLHLILWALYPMKPVLRLKAMLSWFIAALARTLGDDDTLVWLEAIHHPPKGASTTTTILWGRVDDDSVGAQCRARSASSAWMLGLAAPP